MELLRRALLIGFVLPAIWFSRLATLDPLVSVVGIEGAHGPGEGHGNDSSYVSGERWDRFLLDVDAVGHGLGPRSRWRVDAEPSAADGSSSSVYFRPEEIPAGGMADRLASPGGAATVSISRPDGELRYQLERRDWTRREFGPGTGFTGKPAPPGSLLYPFQFLAVACLLAGIGLFAVFQDARLAADALRPAELGSLAVALILFATPLVATGGSVQALTRGLQLTIPCWIFAGVAIHRFARPGMSVRRLLLPIATLAPGANGIEGAKPSFPSAWEIGMLAIAICPLALLVITSLALWNR